MAAHKLLGNENFPIFILVRKFTIGDPINDNTAAIKI